MRILRREEGDALRDRRRGTSSNCRGRQKNETTIRCNHLCDEDDLADGGASVYAQTIQCIREYVKDCMVEVLIPDFGGSSESLEIVLNARPDILNHNIETVPRLYSQVRPMADYKRSLELLKNAKETITVHPHPCPPPSRGRKYSGNKCSPPPVGGVRGGVYCYKKQYTR